jgi:hypothetical protein
MVLWPPGLVGDAAHALAPNIGQGANRQTAPPDAGASQGQSATCRAISIRTVLTAMPAGETAVKASGQI